LRPPPHRLFHSGKKQSDRVKKDNFVVSTFTDKNYYAINENKLLKNNTGQSFKNTLQQLNINHPNMITVVMEKKNIFVFNSFKVKGGLNVAFVVG
jgi:hypothetical protein